MTGLDLAKNDLQLNRGKIFFKRINFLSTEPEIILRENFLEPHGIFVAWQIQKIIWGKFDGEKILLKENISPNFDDILEFRIFNQREEIHLKRLGKNFVGRYIRDENGEGIFFVDSFSRLWGERKNSADGWTTLRDDLRKISMTIPCDGDKKFYGLTTRNYIGNDAATGLSGYVDYRFVALDSAQDGD